MDAGYPAVCIKQQSFNAGAGDDLDTTSADLAFQGRSDGCAVAVGRMSPWNALHAGGIKGLCREFDTQTHQPVQAA